MGCVIAVVVVGFVVVAITNASWVVHIFENVVFEVEFTFKIYLSILTLSTSHFSYFLFYY